MTGRANDSGSERRRTTWSFTASPITSVEDILSTSLGVITPLESTVHRRDPLLSSRLHRRRLTLITTSLHKTSKESCIKRPLPNGAEYHDTSLHEIAREMAEKQTRAPHEELEQSLNTSHWIRRRKWSWHRLYGESSYRSVNKTLRMLWQINRVYFFGLCAIRASTIITRDCIQCGGHSMPVKQVIKNIIECPILAWHIDRTRLALRYSAFSSVI